MKRSVRNFLIFSISIYQRILSPDKGFLKKIGIIKNPVCVFFPSCSLYAQSAIEKYGVRKGVRLAMKRILRCHPWQKNHIDPLK